MTAVVIAALVVIFDQISKLIVIGNLKPDGVFELIEGVLRFRYLENRGAAFGMLSDNRIVFMVASVAIIALLGFVIYKYRGQNKLFDICMGLILGGGVGNMIDRIRLGYVVDFIDFYLFDFWRWVFNIADSAVVVGCILAIVCLVMEQKTGKKLFEQEKSDTAVEQNEKDDGGVNDDE